RLEVRGWMLEAVGHVLASSLVPQASNHTSLNLNLPRMLAGFFNILLSGPARLDVMYLPGFYAHSPY
ncbi:MAG: hypothetical protein ABI988_20385, partial [Nitrospirota bacterium]